MSSAMPLSRPLQVSELTVDPAAAYPPKLVDTGGMVSFERRGPERPPHPSHLGASPCIELTAPVSIFYAGCL